MSRVGIIAEDSSDIDTLNVLLRRIVPTNFKLKRYDAKGCSKLTRKCCAVSKGWVRDNTTHIIICRDCDKNDCAALYRDLRSEVSSIDKHEELICIVIPIEEIEAWLMADHKAFNKRFLKMNLKAINNPENVSNPKEFLSRQSRGKNSKPRYVNSIHNKELAGMVDIEAVINKCPSFHPFYSFATSIN